MPLNISEGELSHIEGGVARNIRLDGRTRTEARSISMQTGVVKTAYGSSHVLLGSEQGIGSCTEVLVAVYGQVIPSDEGSYWFHVDPTPLTASDNGPIDGIDCTKESFACALETQLAAIYGASKPVNKGVHPEATVMFLDTNFPESARIPVDGEGDEASHKSGWEVKPMNHLPSLPLDFPAASKTAIDRSSLNVSEGLSWCLKIEVLVIGSSGGNTILAVTSAVNAALRDTKLPQIEQGVEGSAEIKVLNERTVCIPDTHTLPLASLIVTAKHFFVIDPSAAEEQIPHSKGFVVGIAPSGSLVSVASSTPARTSLAIPVQDMLCVLREAPVLLKCIHENFESAFGEVRG